MEVPCRFCNGFGPASSRKFIPLSGWMEGITQSACELCRVLVQSIKKLDPKILDTQTQDDSVAVYLSSLPERRLICISKSTERGWMNRLMIELYTAKGEAGSFTGTYPCVVISLLIYLPRTSPVRPVVRWNRARHSVNCRERVYVGFPARMLPKLHTKPSKVFGTAGSRVVPRTVASFNRVSG